MTTAQQWQRDTCNMIDDAPVTFTWESGTYIGTTGQKEATGGFVGGGYLDQFDYILITCPKKLANETLVDRFAGSTRPAIDDLIVIDDTTYTAGTVVTDEYDSCIVMGLVSEKGPRPAR